LGQFLTLIGFTATFNYTTSNGIGTIACAPITTTYSYDHANRLTAVNAQSYTWDANGNLLADGVLTYTYDAANRLIMVTQGLTQTAGFVYNGLATA
jgi:uncharacterized protein RhaS with RHS repeats